MIEQREVMDVIKESDKYKSETSSSHFGDRHLNNKDQKAVMGSEHLGSLVGSLKKAFSR